MNTKYLPPLKKAELEEFVGDDSVLKDPDGTNNNLHIYGFKTNEDENAIDIDFYSEYHPEDLMTLKIKFHKGNTFFGWITNKGGEVIKKNNPSIEEEEENDYIHLPF